MLEKWYSVMHIFILQFKAMLDLLPDLDNNSTLRFVLEHWFNNSTDPNSLLTQIQRMGSQMSNIAKCFRIDRFVIVKDEEELEQRAMCLTTHDQYFSGVVFLNVSEKSTTFPDFVTYKIRHNPKLVDSESVLQYEGKLSA